MRVMTMVAAAGTLVLAACSSGGAEQNEAAATHRGHSAPAADTAGAVNSPATAAYKAVNARMHRDMDVAFTGDPDADFMAAMIPHHEGAVAMARVALEHGRDPEVRTLAQAVIEAQESEISLMRRWLEQRGQRSASAQK